MDQVIQYILNRYANIHVEGEENLLWARTNPCIFTCNHLSNADGLVLNHVLKHAHSIPITFIAGVKLKDSIFSKLALDSIDHIAIQPDSSDRQAIKQAIQTVRSGLPILIFPEGGRSRTGQLIEGKKGVVLIQKMSKVPIVPIALTGTDHLMPINDEDMSHEAFTQATIHLRVGTPYLPTEAEADDIHSIMYRIADLLPYEYRGVYGDELYKKIIT